MIEGRVVGPLAVNCYLISCPETKKAAVVDPGDEGSRIIRWIQDKGYQVEYVLLTHGHADHIGAVDMIRDQFQAKVAIHERDAAMLTDGRRNLSTYIGAALELRPADRLLQDGEILSLGTLTLKVIATPGHSQGSICFLTEDGLVSGDTLFEGSIGRTDFPGGSLEELLSGVKKKLFVLPEDTRVYPGHGSATTIGKEKRDNPFLR